MPKFCSLHMTKGAECPEPRIMSVFSRMTDLLNIEEALERTDKLCEALDCLYLLEEAPKK